MDPQNTTVKSKTAAKFAIDLSKNATTNIQKSFAASDRKSLERTLSNIFPTQKDENNLQRARRILGDLAVSLSDPELETYLVEFEYLIDSWLDEFEKNIFNDKTLMQLLKEG
jgi:hypothetical protein